MSEFEHPRLGSGILWRTTEFDGGGIHGRRNIPSGAHSVVNPGVRQADSVAQRLDGDTG